MNSYPQVATLNILYMIFSSKLKFPKNVLENRIGNCFYLPQGIEHLTLVYVILQVPVIFDKDNIFVNILENCLKISLIQGSEVIAFYNVGYTLAAGGADFKFENLAK